LVYEIEVDQEAALSAETRGTKQLLMRRGDFVKTSTPKNQRP